MPMFLRETETENFRLLHRTTPRETQVEWTYNSQRNLQIIKSSLNPSQVGKKEVYKGDEGGDRREGDPEGVIQLTR